MPPSRTPGHDAGPPSAPPPEPDENPSNCRRCELWRTATQAVAGAGPRDAAVMLVGEQPGDEEDLRGEPFVGPAGTLLNRALMAAGLVRDKVFITNAVKHFKWQARGKRRLHKTPTQQEIVACEVWLQQDLMRCTAPVVVALGATAFRALTGQARGFADARARGAMPLGSRVLVITWHPSAALRVPNVDMRRAIYDDIVSALKRAAELAATAPTEAQ